MKKIRAYFAELKKSMPKHTQWVLLGIGLVLCLMLIVLLSGPGGGAKSVQAEKSKEATLSVTPGKIDFGTVEVGKSAEHKISVSASAPAVVVDVAIAPAAAGLLQTSTCVTQGKVSDSIPCYITLTFAPTGLAGGDSAVNIKYYDAAGSRDLEKMETVKISFASKAAADTAAEQPAAAAAEQSAESKPEPEPAPIIKEEIPDDLVVEEDPFMLEPEPEPEPVAPAPAPKPAEPAAAKPKPQPVLPSPKVDDYVPQAEECYHFAFAGYNNAGKQIGWIKPEGGHYMFHPFDDTTCDSPTGEYNSKTGFIMSLDDPTKKIGSDGEHIGGRGAGRNLAMPALSNPAPVREFVRAKQGDEPEAAAGMSAQVLFAPKPQSELIPSSLKNGQQATMSSRPYDRTFVLRHFKPIPATIVNEVRAVDPKKTVAIPVQATVDRHVYSDNGRTIIIPAGTLMLGNVEGDMPGPYKTVGRINIVWYRFIRPDGVEFNFNDEKPFSGDSQGRVGVPGYGSTDYLEQMVLPLLTAIVPAATNLIAPISDKIVNQIDLDNNVIVQNGTMRSSELAKQEMIKSWNKVTEKLFIDMMDNTKPPFSIASGTRITVYSPDDLVVAWCDKDDTCPLGEPDTSYAKSPTTPKWTVGESEPESVYGQAWSYISGDDEKIKDARMKQLMKGFEQYQSKSMAANKAYEEQLNNNQGIQKADGGIITKGSKEYNEQVLGLKYKDGVNGEFITNPNTLFSPEKPAAAAAAAAAEAGLSCDDGSTPDGFGCCTGETFVDGVCCPEPDNPDAECFPPLE